jgi:Flp pilus assembly protein TadG
MLSKRAYAIRRKGTAAIELLLVAPLLALLVIMIFFMGWSLVDMLQVQTADRYVAWRHVYGYNDNDPRPIPDKINQYFMRNEAANVTINLPNAPAAPGGTLQSYKARTRTDDAEAGDLVDKFTSYAPAGAESTVNAQFPTSVGAWQWMARDAFTRRTSGRDGDEWRWNNRLTQSETVRQLYMTDVETTMGNIGGQGAGMAQAIRNWYMGGW